MLIGYVKLVDKHINNLSILPKKGLGLYNISNMPNANIQRHKMLFCLDNIVLVLNKCLGISRQIRIKTKKIKALKTNNKSLPFTLSLKSPR